MLSCTIPTSVAMALAMAGKAGRYMSMAIGPMGDRAPMIKTAFLTVGGGASPWVLGGGGAPGGRALSALAVGGCSPPWEGASSLRSNGMLIAQTHTARRDFTSRERARRREWSSGRR